MKKSVVIIILFVLIFSINAESNSARTLYAKGIDFENYSDYYSAVEVYISALKIAPDYADCMVALARCYYELGEYSEALSNVAKAKKYKLGDITLLNLEGYIYIGLRDLIKAEKTFNEVIKIEPNNIDSRFGLAQLDLSKGLVNEARDKYTETLRVAPENAKALLSLAIIYHTQGNEKASLEMIDRALRYHGAESQTQYFAGYLSLIKGEYIKAEVYCTQALDINKKNAMALKLLAEIKYLLGKFQESEALMITAINQNRRDAEAWFTLAIARIANLKIPEAITALKTCLTLKPDDEIARIALENVIIDTTALEDLSRESLSEYHYVKGKGLEGQGYYDLALFEYTRALKIYPYSVKIRLGYADLLKKKGLNSKYLSELKFINEIGKADTKIKDLIEIYSSLLINSVSMKWNIDQFSIRKEKYVVPFFYMQTNPNPLHLMSTEIVTRYIASQSLHSQNIFVPTSMPYQVGSFSDAYKKARDAETDYFVIVDLDETVRDVRIKITLYSSRTATEIASFDSYRSGNDRLKNTVKNVFNLLEKVVPFYGEILVRKTNNALIDRGSVDGVKKGDILTIIKKGTAELKTDVAGFTYLPEDIVGTLEITSVDEEVSEGVLKRSDFYDMINNGDVVIKVPEQKQQNQVVDKNFPGLFETVNKIK